MTLPWQIAQKLHAVTEVPEGPRTNDRAHDLVDLQLLEALLVDEPLTKTRAASVAVFNARAKHVWPPIVRAQPHWSPIYRRALDGLNHLQLAPTVEEAVERVQAFVDRIEESR
ncbi:MAG TPA: nucleotidyl transferase AbiEii/AbiGii toxin family protein [Aeromicrobium sp.]|nr:nucleotidyl transferase AbiEii/AbiGii toxin family protein [Aeromicrobium sp.]